MPSGDRVRVYSLQEGRDFEWSGGKGQGIPEGKAPDKEVLPHEISLQERKTKGGNSEWGKYWMRRRRRPKWVVCWLCAASQHHCRTCSDLCMAKNSLCDKLSGATMKNSETTAGDGSINHRDERLEERLFDCAGILGR